MFLEIGSELEAAQRVDAGFERRDAEQTPLGIGDGLKERALGIGKWFTLCYETRDMGLVGFDVIAWQQEGAASQSCFESIQRRGGAARF